MEIAIIYITAGTSLLIAIGLIAAVLSRRVYDGVLIKIGLCCTALGFIVVAMHMLKLAGADMQGLQRALLLVNSGFAVIIVGYAFRAHKAGHKLRRVTDWAELDTRPVEENHSGFR